jgi:hypothetical protein
MLQKGLKMDEFDELGRPKPDPNAVLKDGEWWLNGAPCANVACPPACSVCAFNQELIKELTKELKQLRAVLWEHAKAVRMMPHSIKMRY